jgi:hypothetical protein
METITPEIVMEFLATASPDAKEQIAKFLAKDHIMQTEQMDVHDRYRAFVDSGSNHNAIMWAPTQVGKSAAMIDFIEMCFRLQIPAIVSTDNKTDQCEQLYDRILCALGSDDVKLLRVSDKTFTKQYMELLKTSNNRYVLFCLNNAAQIDKLHDAMMLASTPKHNANFRNTSRFALVHDEGDTVTKDQDVDIANASQCASHRAWINFVDTFHADDWNMDIGIKRVFVTATPENCCTLYNITCPVVFGLPVPDTYVGYTKIAYDELKDSALVRDIIRNEVQRVKEAGTNEVILYCVQRKIANGQDSALVSLATNVDCTVHTYNGKGVHVMFKTEVLATMFEKCLRKNKIRYTRTSEIAFDIKKIPIRTFYTICKQIGENCVVTIGMDLIARGISYVGEDKTEPLTATVMVYKPGKTMHAVGIAQTVGRITGCAMPKLPRKLYAPKDVIDTYIKYNQNQEKYIAAITDETEKKLTKDIINNLELKQYKRSIDRPKVLKKMGKAEKLDTCVADDDTTRMQQLVRMWWTSDSITGRVLRLLYAHSNGVKTATLYTFVRDQGSSNPNQLIWHLTTNGKDYNLVFEKCDDMYNINFEARQYIQKTFVEA